MITLIKKKALVAILISHEVDHRANKYYSGKRRLLHNGKGIDQNSQVTAGMLEASLGGRDTLCMNS